MPAIPGRARRPGHRRYRAHFRRHRTAAARSDVARQRYVRRFQLFAFCVQLVQRHQIPRSDGTLARLSRLERGSRRVDLLAALAAATPAGSRIKLAPIVIADSLPCSPHRSARIPAFPGTRTNLKVHSSARVL